MGSTHAAPYDQRAAGSGGSFSSTAGQWGNLAEPQQFSNRDRDQAYYYENSQATSRPQSEGGILKALDYGVKSIWGKMRNIVVPGSDIAANSGDAMSRNPYGYDQRMPSQGLHPQTGYYSPYPYVHPEQRKQISTPPAGDSGAAWQQAVQPPSRVASTFKAGYPGSGSLNWVEDSRAVEDFRSAETVSASMPIGTIRSDDTNKLKKPNAVPAEGSNNIYTGSDQSTGQRLYGTIESLAQIPRPEEPAAVLEAEPQVAPEPQIFVIDGCIVLIPRPVEYFRKKRDIVAAGSQQLNVFSDFERTMTNFRAPNGGAYSPSVCFVQSNLHTFSELSYSTMELLETSNALFPQVNY